jgi:hypothetical protein
VISTSSSSEITHDVELEDTVESALKEAVAVGIATTSIITQDISGETSIDGNSTVAIPVNTATVITIN